MADAHYENPRLAAVYDPLEADRPDLAVYAALAAELRDGTAAGRSAPTHSVLDIGCGTGTFACLLASRGHRVTGLDPAQASLEVARAKPFADRVRWIHGPAAALPPDVTVDLVTMTGNVAQVFVTDDDWAAVLHAARRALTRDGRLVFETRDPARRAWRDWDRAHSYLRQEVPGAGPVEFWTEVTGVSGELVTFRATYVFEADGTVLTSVSTLRFRSEATVTESLADAGFAVTEIRDAPDRPGKELVFVARLEPALTG